jgi:hypothetical protein
MSASSYAWIITQNILEHCPAKVIGPRSAPEALVKELTAGAGQPFRLFDDDGHLYYEGRIVGRFEGFEPLDDYGQPNAGCTSIQLRTEKGWEVV